MKCPLCNSKSHIKETRERKRVRNIKDKRFQEAGPTTYRRHVCLNPNCSHAFSTYEVEQLDYQRLVLLIDNALKTEVALKETNTALTKLIRQFTALK